MSEVDLKFSPTARTIFALLNNINDLVSQSNDRNNADDVMRALSIYANGKDFALPQLKIDNFHEILIDSRSTTISELLRSIAVDVVKQDASKAKNSKA